MNHLEEAKNRLVYVSGRIAEKKGYEPIDVELIKSYALIAIAEQLEDNNRILAMLGEAKRLLGRKKKDK